MTNNRIWTLLTRKLAGEASATEMQELEQLIEKDPSILKSITDVTAWWNENPKVDTDFIEATYLAHVERMKAKGISIEDELSFSIQKNQAEKTRRSSFFRKALFGLVFIFLAACTWVFFIPEKKQPSLALKKKPTEKVLTQNADRKKILLPDGSTVWLNSGSELKYNKDFSTGERVVYLSGEAFFDVVKIKERPFIIHTAHMNVRVLGTRFNVKAYKNDNSTETSLIRGSVEVFLSKDPAKKYLLKPNEKLILQNQYKQQAEEELTKSTRETEPGIQIKELTYLNGSWLDIESSWTQNILSFNDESFLEVAKKMERWYDVKFEFKNKNKEQLYLSGSFEKENIDQAMKALKFSTGFDFKIEENIVSIY